MVTNLDVTLRDGAYQNNFSFALEYAALHCKILSKAKEAPYSKFVV